MSRKTLTFRADESIAAALAHLSRILHQPVNQLVTDAVTTYLARRSREVERDLEARLADLRAYRHADPDFENAIDAFADAEARVDDPLEGTPVRRRRPVRQEIDSLLNG